MSSIQATAALPTTTRRQVQAADVAILTRIYDADVNLAVWQRSLSQQVSAYANWLLEQPLGFSWQEAIGVSQALPRAQEALPAHEHKEAFVADLAEIIDMYCCLFELDAVGLRLRVLGRAMCPKFHSDRVPCRLVTTYGGAGTQWRSQQSGDDADVQQISDGAVALLKGDAWRGNEGQGLLHRSPALAPRQKRLLLTLDFG